METEINNMAIQPITNTISQPAGAFQHVDTEKSPKAVKFVATATSALGVATAVALIAKRQGFSLKPKNIMNTPVKDWAIFKITDKNRPDEKVMKFEWKEIMSMGIGSVLGGLAGGALVDKKENLPSKCQEAVSQLIGDITIPLSIVALPTMAYKKFEDLASKKTNHVKLQNISKAIQSNKVLKILCPTLVSGTSLFYGILAGNKVSNKINSHVSGQDVSRGIRITDFAPHLDDVCLAITLMASKSPVGDIISKFVPFALTVAGVETGSATPENRAEK